MEILNTLMFTDIASFTDISEKLSASEVVNMLNLYFKKANFLFKWSNIYVDKYIGDAIMAFWEDNINFDLITDRVLKFQLLHPNLQSDILNLLWKEISLKTRIGLHFGEAVVGDVWDENKLNYTAIWDNVNLASRLEWINKYYNTRVIMSEEFYKNIKNKTQFAIRLLDKITVKWKTQPVKIYELMIIPSDKISLELLDYIKKFESGLNDYFEWKFKSSYVLFKELLSTPIGKQDKTLKIFLERLEFLLKSPPKEWDGVWRFKTK